MSLTTLLPDPLGGAYQEEFEKAITTAGYDARDPWIDNYANYEWDHARHVIQSALGSIDGFHTLEFGCFVGATAIVMAQLGAKVEAVDINRETLNVSRANAKRYQLQNSVNFTYVEDSRVLPFADHSFDLIFCNSVLEYVPDAHRTKVLQEIDRLLKPGGRLQIVGTSNRLWPSDVHARRQFTNWLPQQWFRFLYPTDDYFPRGVWPWQVTRQLPYTNQDKQDFGNAYVAARRRMGTSSKQLKLLNLLKYAAAVFGMSVGELGRTICVTLRKPSS